MSTIIERRIGVLLGHGNYEAAKAVIDEAERAKDDTNTMPILEVTLQDAGMPMRVANILERCSILRIGDMRKVPSEHLLEMPSFSFTSLDTAWRTVLKLAAGRDAMRAAGDAILKSQR